MRRHAFTLMELLVSVALLTLIVLFMYGAIGSSKLANKTLKKHTLQEQNRTMVFNLLYRDIFQSISIQTSPTKNKHFTIVELQTLNSLHNIAAPHVTYFVNSQSKKLIRLEAARKIKLPIRYEEKHIIHADIIFSDVQDFNLYTNSKIQDAKDEKAVDNTIITNPGGEGDESLSSSDDANVTDKNTTIDSGYLLYLNAQHLDNPLLMEISIN